MNWHIFYPTRVFFGEACMAQNSSALKNLGRKALIVSGAGGSCKHNGSLDDVISALKDQDIPYVRFDRVEANPSVETCRAGAECAREHQADFIIGIGGGSPLDAAKAMAILAVNDFNDEELFTNQPERILPFVAVPTTSGTGSEATPYSILTCPAIENKRSIFNAGIIPALAYLDPLYTRSLPWQITLDTAVDAYSHALESCLSRRANPFSEMLALEALAILGVQLRRLSEGQIPDLPGRERLLYGSMLGGMAISVTATNIPHAMGYPFTYHKDIPHGRANGMIMPAYIDFLMESDCADQVDIALRKSHFQSAREFRRIMETLTGPPPSLTAEEREVFINTSSQARNLQAALRAPDRTDVARILDRSLHR